MLIPLWASSGELEANVREGRFSLEGPCRHSLGNEPGDRQGPSRISPKKASEDLKEESTQPRTSLQPPLNIVSVSSGEFEGNVSESRRSLEGPRRPHSLRKPEDRQDPSRVSPGKVSEDRTEESAQPHTNLTSLSIVPDMDNESKMLIDQTVSQSNSPKSINETPLADAQKTGDTSQNGAEITAAMETEIIPPDQPKTL